MYTNIALYLLPCLATSPERGCLVTPSPFSCICSDALGIVTSFLPIRNQFRVSCLSKSIRQEFKKSFYSHFRWTTSLCIRLLHSNQFTNQLLSLSILWESDAYRNTVFNLPKLKRLCVYFVGDAHIDFKQSFPNSGYLTELNYDGGYNPSIAGQFHLLQRLTINSQWQQSPADIVVSLRELQELHLVDISEEPIVGNLFPILENIPSFTILEIRTIKSESFVRHLLPEKLNDFKTIDVGWRFHTDSVSSHGIHSLRIHDFITKNILIPHVPSLRILDVSILCRNQSGYPRNALDPEEWKQVFMGNNTLESLSLKLIQLDSNINDRNFIAINEILFSFNPTLREFELHIHSEELQTRVKNLFPSPIRS